MAMLCFLEFCEIGPYIVGLGLFYSESWKRLVNVRLVQTERIWRCSVFWTFVSLGPIDLGLGFLTLEEGRD